ncbi:hypothetical protein [Streptomyces albidoflavus]|uniref:hypothetical protein n=1 Tax=Streptomyces albidoflavus TaxID=1886 RepID=UPI001021AE0A|nr:hypothetical protein [Streptomyces albidoflavus]RZE73281.1 hypothetical protein C0R02_27475 [Streptomyces albidoflavus]
MSTCRRSRACYLAGCRNEPCRAANYRYMKRLQYDHARGQKRRIDATQTRVWVERLAAHGWTRTQIADAAGTTPTTIRRIAVGEARNINRSIAAGVLAIPLGRPDQGRIDAAGTIRRLRALAVLGYLIHTIAEASGMDTSMLQGHLAAQHATIPAPIARRIASTYRRLCFIPGPSQISRTRAAARGWHGPLAWDDIDDPACQSSDGVSEQDGAVLSRDELAARRRAEVEHLGSYGASAQEIADRVGLAVKYVENILRQLENGQANSRAPKADPATAIPAACGA